MDFGCELLICVKDLSLIDNDGLDSEFSCKIVTKGRDLLRLMDSNNGMGACILLDKSISDMDWWTVLTMIYKQSCMNKVIVLSKYYDVHAAILAAKSGAYDYCYGSSLSLATLTDTIKRAKKDPLSEKNWHDIFLKDDAYERSEKTQLDDLAAVRLDSHSLDYQTDFMKYVLNNIKNEITVDYVIDAIEHVFNKKIKELKKSQMLLVEDELAVSEAMKCVLENVFDIDLAKSSKDALLILESKKDYKIITIDQRLGDSLGSELYLEIKNRIEKVPVIFISAEQSSQLIIQMIKKGVHDYVLKPFSTDELILSITRTLCHYIWPYYQDKINLQELSFKQRLAFLNYDITRHTDQNKDFDLGNIVCLFPEIIIQNKLES